MRHEQQRGGRDGRREVVFRDADGRVELAVRLRADVADDEFEAADPVPAPSPDGTPAWLAVSPAADGGRPIVVLIVDRPALTDEDLAHARSTLRLLRRSGGIPPAGPTDWN